MLIPEIDHLAVPHLRLIEVVVEFEGPAGVDAVKILDVEAEGSDCLF